MLKVIIPSQSEFSKYKKKLKNMYEENQDKIGDDSSFEEICNNCFFYTFLTPDDILVGVIYFFLLGNILYLNAFSSRKMLSEKLEALRLSTTWFDCDIYAEAQNRASAFCLLRSGFKRVQGKLFCYSKGQNKRAE